jgi:hypothetical protein
MDASRSAAASCVFSIVAKHQVDNHECLGLKLLKNQICPVIVSSLDNETKDNADEQMSNLEDALKLAALVGSAAARRGRVSSLTADEVARFLVLISCEGAASAPALGITHPLDCMGDAKGKRAPEISILAASALGSMFNVDSGNPFARQRLAHLVVPIVLSSTVTQGEEISSTALGCLLCASHVVCGVPVKAMDQQKLFDLASIIIRGLEKVVALICSDSKTSQFEPEMLQGSLNLLLASLLKLYNQCPSTILPHLGTLVPTLLLITISMNGIHTASLNLFAIQLLMCLTESTNDGVVHFCKAYKSTVLKHLAKSLDHPSVQVRQAAVQGRNIWSVIE